MTVMVDVVILSRFETRLDFRRSSMDLAIEKVQVVKDPSLPATYRQRVDYWESLETTR